MVCQKASHLVKRSPWQPLMVQVGVVKCLSCQLGVQMCRVALVVPTLMLNRLGPFRFARRLSGISLIRGSVRVVLRVVTCLSCQLRVDMHCVALVLPTLMLNHVGPFRFARRLSGVSLIRGSIRVVLRVFLPLLRIGPMP